MNCNNWTPQSPDVQMHQQNRVRTDAKASNRFSSPRQIESKTKSRKKDRSRKVQARRKGPVSRCSSIPRLQRPRVAPIPLSVNLLISHKEVVNSYLNISLIFNEEYILQIV